MPTTPQLYTILDAVASGDSAAFMQIVQMHSLMLRSYIGAQVFNASDVEDLAQESFVAAFYALPNYRRDEDFAGWLRGIARKKVLMYFRSSQRRANALERFRAEVAEIVSQQLEVSAAFDSQETIAALLRCIHKLPERLRRVVHAGLDGMKAATVAQMLDTTPGAVYQLHYRANQLLRDCVTKEVQDV